MTLAVGLLVTAGLLVAAVAILLWRGAQTSARRHRASELIDTQVSLRASPAPVVDSGPSEAFRVHAGRRPARGPQNWRQFMLRAGIVPTIRFYIFQVLIVVLSVVPGLFLGRVAIIVLPVLAVIALFFRLWLKAERRRRAMIRQIPEFLDRVVRLMTVGHSIGSSFHQAVMTTATPLNEVMARVVSLHRSGQELDISIRHVSRQYGLQELYLVAAVVGVALRFGGRSDQVLERMSAFMRDLEQARAEMSAMSAELRLSAWVLALLPLGLACFILVFNNDLFMGMWHDPMGMRLLIGAVVLQVVGSWWLYSLAKSV